MIFKLDKEAKRLKKIKPSLFSESKIKERGDIQEWIKKNPEIISEDLLIITDEWDGAENKERLDLLAIDSDGALVVIELKRDNSGQSVYFQALKYVSYCFQLTSAQIIKMYEDYNKKNRIEIDAQKSLLGHLKSQEENDKDKTDEEILRDELNNNQKIILTANEFDEKVLTVVAWLHEKKIDIKCFEIQPYTNNSNEIFINVNQIFPPKKLEDFFVKIRNKLSEQTFQSNDIVNFFHAIKEKLNETHEIVNYNEKKTYCNINSGLNGKIWFDLIYYKGKANFAIQLTTKDKEIKRELFGWFNRNKEYISNKTKLTFKEEEGSKNPDWGKIKTTIQGKKELKDMTDEISLKLINVINVMRESLENEIKENKIKID